MTDDAPALIASNRGPVSFRERDGELVAARGGGGLAAGLRPLLAGRGVRWLAAAMDDADRRAAAEGVELDDFDLRLVVVGPDVFRAAYDVIANQTLWYALHELWDRPRRPVFDRAWREAWSHFETYSRAFADGIADSAPDGAVVLVQDYHLVLVGALLAEARPDVKAVHFSHTPFSGPDAWRVLPQRTAHAVLEGMAGFTAAGFHTRRWAQRYRESCQELIGVTSPTFVSPLASDPDALRRDAAGEAVERHLTELTDQIGDRAVIARADRIELSKNVVRGFRAFEDLLVEHPDLLGHVVFCANVYPSREGVADYLAYRQEIEWEAERVNRRFATPDWTPVLLSVADDFPRTMALLRRADVVLVNPIRDGLNLVAKEAAIVNERDAVLVLSRDAGVSDEVGGSAIGINPYDVVETSDALHRALTMAVDERRDRALRWRSHAEGRRPEDWLTDQMEAAGR